MTATSAAPASTPPGSPVRAGRTRNTAVTILQVYVVTLIALPNDIGIPGVPGLSPPILVAMSGLALWLAGAFLGLHHPSRRPNPVRISILALWLATLLSFIAMQFLLPTPAEVDGSQRWFLQIASWTGVVLLASDLLQDGAELQRVLRTLTWAGAVMGFVSLVQFQFSFDLATYLRYVPGFVSSDTGYVAITARGARARVAGTALHPIELGATAATILPLAVVGALQMRRKRWVLRWGPVFLVAVPLATSLSRSAILAVVVSGGILLVCLTPVQRLVGLAMSLAFAVLAFLLAPGTIATLTYLFTGAGGDPSVRKRQLQVPIVEELIRQHPWFGRGGGTLIPATRYTDIVFNNIFDNQYFGTAIQLGLVGLVLVVGGYVLLPPVVAVVARGRSRNGDTRLLAGALTGAAAASIVTWYTFDFLSFPKSAGLQALVIGLIGAVWCLVRLERMPAHEVGNPRIDGTLDPSGSNDLDAP